MSGWIRRVPAVRLENAGSVLGLMRAPWMLLIAVVALAQKLLPARTAIDIPLALAIVGLES